jgi:hypothetical protein
MTTLSTFYKSGGMSIWLSLGALILDAKLQPDYTAVKDDHYGAVRVVVAPSNFRVRIVVERQVSPWGATKLETFDWFGYSLGGMDRYMCQTTGGALAPLEKGSSGWQTIAEQNMQD